MSSLLVDLHHSDLFESHRLVFGDRFGWEVVAPYGMEWFERDYWTFEKAWHGDAVAKQYLSGIWQGAEPDANGYVRVQDSRHPDRTLVGVTLEAALARDWALVMSSVPANAPGFRALARETHAQWAIHIGNQWGDEAWYARPDFAIVTTTSPIPSDVRHVVVHQEFSLDTFRPGIHRGRSVASFVQCLADNPRAWAEFLSFARDYPEFDWKVYGSYGQHEPDEFAAGNLGTTPDVADAMRQTRIGWHVKEWSDGFGHVIHNLFASGTPVIARAGYYADKLAGPLFVDGETSFDIDRHSRDEIIATMRRLRDDDDYCDRISENAARRFREVVDFDHDADLIADLVGAAVAA